MKPVLKNAPPHDEGCCLLKSPTPKKKTCKWFDKLTINCIQVPDHVQLFLRSDFCFMYASCIHSSARGNAESFWLATQLYLRMSGCVAILCELWRTCIGPICIIGSAEASRVVFIPRAQPHAQSFFLFPIVFGINLITYQDNCTHTHKHSYTHSWAYLTLGQQTEAEADELPSPYESS